MPSLRHYADWNVKNSPALKCIQMENEQMANDVLTAKELDKIGCPVCCGGIDIHPPCHFGSSVKIHYWHNVLTIRCATCDATVCRIGIADEIKGSL